VRIYLQVTALLFGAIVALHLWRARVEGWQLLREPFFVGVTLLSAMICGWAVALLVRRPRH